MDEPDLLASISTNFPNTQLAVRLNLAPALTPTEFAKARGKIIHRTRQDANCPYTHNHTPVPFYGPSSDTFTIIGEAPGKEEERLGKPFVGPSGKLMRAMVQQYAGVDPDEVFWMNTMPCHPKAEGSTRAPKHEEMLLRRRLLLDTLALTQSQRVLLVGATALSAFRGDLKLSRVHGQVFVWMGKYVVMPVWHPALILRKMEMKSELARDLTQWGELVRGDWRTYRANACTRCGAGLYNVDPDGVGYCQQHWEKYGMKVWGKQQKRWVVPGGKQSSVWDYADPI